MRNQIFRCVMMIGLSLLMLNVVACGSATTAPAITTAPTTSVTTSAPATSTPRPSVAATPPAAFSPTPNVVTAAPAPTTTSQNPTLAFNFERDAVDGLPSGAIVFSGTWAVRAENDAPSPPNALCQMGTATYPALSLTNAQYGDVTIITRFKAISGQADQAAGIIFRIQDKDNYYIVRANALENNVIIFKYVGGQRTQIKEGAAKVGSGKWQELRVEVIGNRIRGLLDGNSVVETTDNTFKNGGVGLWTKADSVTCFDDVRVFATPT